MPIKFSINENNKIALSEFKSIKLLDNDFREISSEIILEIYKYICNNDQDDKITSQDQTKLKLKVNKEELYYHFQTQRCLNLLDIENTITFLIDQEYIIQHDHDIETELIRIPSLFWTIQDEKNTRVEKKSFKSQSLTSPFVVNYENYNGDQNEKGDDTDDDNGEELESKYHSKYMYDEARNIFELLIHLSKYSRDKPTAIKLTHENFRSYLKELNHNYDNSTINFALDYLHYINHLL